MTTPDRILVTRSSMPPFEEYVEEIRGLWDSHWLTNMGEKHEALEAALKNYLGVPDIALFVKNSSEIDELSFRQLVDDKYTEQHYLEDYLRMGHKKLWWYIEQNDYNLYYAENEVSGRYRDFEKEES